jgi:signal transduction histidine kinase
MSFVTALTRLLRTTAFKLSLAFLLIFAVGAGLVAARVGFGMKTLLDDQIRAVIDVEVQGLFEQFQQGQAQAVRRVIERRVREPGASIYLLATAGGVRIAGNAETLAADDLAKPGLREIEYRSLDAESPRRRRALARVVHIHGGELRLLVGRDLEDREALRRVMGRALVTSVIWMSTLAVLAGALIAWRVTRRVDAMNAAAMRVTEGDLEARLPMQGKNDEFDRLAASVNAMVERIGALLRGMREVSDNVAHDLRTPLTRIRNRAEEALRGQGEAARPALEKIIQEADELISAFEALLTIARAESGANLNVSTSFDVTGALQALHELYEPVAEEQGVNFTLEASQGLIARGHRDLISRAVGNLVDNALKHGAAGDGLGHVALRAQAKNAHVEIVVSDDGPGVPEADRERVQERFVRLAAERSAPGSGLGLSLVAAVARLHGAPLTLEDNRPGLRATLRLPAASVAGEPK